MKIDFEDFSNVFKDIIPQNPILNKFQRQYYKAHQMKFEMLLERKQIFKVDENKSTIRINDLKNYHQLVEDYLQNYPEDKWSKFYFKFAHTVHKHLMAKDIKI